MNIIQNKKLIELILIFLSGFQYMSAQGIIVLEESVPATPVTVVATQQVILKPGFHAVGSNGSFNARIGTVNNVYPLIPLAQGSTAVIPTDPSADQNYIRTSTYLTADANSPVLNTIQYFDGLGRPTQTVAQGITPSGADLVSNVVYDDAGREWKKYLPASVTGNYGQFVPETNLNNAQSNTYSSDSRPYVETLLEASPLNRITGEIGAGQDWGSNHKTTIDYQTNDGTVAYYFVNSNNQLERGANYAASMLYKTVSADEDGKTTTEYKDKLGQTVMKRSSTNVDTYYVYNDLRQLSYVIPPIATDSLPATGTIDDDNGVLRRYAYLYKYDERGNCIQKRLPGCNWIYMVYDKADRLVLSQDGNQRPNNKWTVTKYDVLGRPLYTSEVIDGTSFTNQLSSFKNWIVTESFTTLAQTYPMEDTGYSRGFYHQAPTKLLTVNYYDDYSFLDMTPNEKAKFIYDNSKEQQGYPAPYPNAKGLLTGTRTYILDKTNTYLTTALYYDDRGRVVQTRSSNHLGGYDMVYNAYDFTGHVTKTLKTHDISGQVPIDELYTYFYDQAGRPTITKYKLGTKDEITLSSNFYDELGRLTTKTRHTGADTETNEYNIRNWATKLKSGTFEENLYYNINLPQVAKACYNGNISYNTWTYNTNTNGYVYQYNELNRLTSGQNTDSSHQMDGGNSELFSYDKQGNITWLGRMENGGDIDNLYFRYNGNQIKWIYDDAGSQNQYNMKEYNERNPDPDSQMIEFTYDKNGNMISDFDRNIAAIRYNILNLPDTVQFGNGNQIINKYDASGRKLCTRYYTLTTGVVVPIGTTRQWVYDMDIIDETGTFYVDNFEYKFNGCDPGYYLLDKVYNPEGYADRLATTGGPYYNYYRRDHLGSIREVWCANTNSTIQRTQYYASGLPWSEGTGQDIQNHKYNGKEFVEMHGLDAYDYGARLMFPDRGPVLPTVDPLAEKYYSISPYVYCAGNPVNAIDPNGEDYIVTIQRNKKNEIIGITFTATVYIAGDGVSKERAKELNNLAKETFKSKESNGVKIEFDVNYEYAPNKTQGDLVDGKGQNLLTFTNDKVDRENGDDSRIYDDRDATHSGYEGIIYNEKGKSSNYDVMHETFHLLGFSDRYDPNTGKSNDGYKNDLMGTNGKFDLSPNHYANMYEFALRQPAFQQYKYLKRLSSDIVVDQWFKHGNPNNGTLKR